MFVIERGAYNPRSVRNAILWEMTAAELREYLAKPEPARGYRRLTADEARQAVRSGILHQTGFYIDGDTARHAAHRLTAVPGAADPGCTLRVFGPQDPDGGSNRRTEQLDRGGFHDCRDP